MVYIVNKCEIFSKCSRSTAIYLTVWYAGNMNFNFMWVLAVHWIQTMFMFLLERHRYPLLEQRTNISISHLSNPKKTTTVSRRIKGMSAVFAVLLFSMLGFVSFHIQSPALTVQRLHPTRDLSAHTVCNCSQIHTKCMQLDSERLRRQADEKLNELWHYTRTFLDTLIKIKHMPDANKSLIVHGRRTIQDHHHLINAYMLKLRQAGDLDRERQCEADALQRIVQNRFHYLQNPSNCKTAKRLVCKKDGVFGYGCKLNSIVYCFAMAYGLQRTMILKLDTMGDVGQVWGTHFLPVSNCHMVKWEEDVKPLISHNQSDLVVSLSADQVEKNTYVPDFLPLAIPEDLAPRLKLIFKDPGVWWLGQIIKYLTRPREQWREQLIQKRDLINFTSPIVGVHVRRTDKLVREAKFHALTEYMELVDDYYDRLEMVQGNLVERKLYLASEEPQVYIEAKTKYPNYIILGEPDSTVSNPKERSSETALNSIILDIFFLSHCDYVVCTFSSNVCRAVFAEMQTYHTDASNRVYSLDAPFFFIGQQPLTKQAVFNHDAGDASEISIRLGDNITISTNHKTRFSKGLNQRSKAVGFFPFYKVEDIIVEATMPTYKEADQQLQMGLVN